MKQILLVFILASALYGYCNAQLLNGSNLPIVLITTDNGVEIPDDPRVRASMKIIYRGPGERNYLTDQNNPLFLDYNGRIDIEIRGSSSQSSDKKQYGFTTRLADNVTNNNVSLLGMPEENDWILNGMVFDPALIRDFLSYNLSRKIGQYASRTEYCELMINGQYKGLYVLQEKLKADNNRIDITKIEKTDNSFPDITGGYITKADKTTGGDIVAWEMLSWINTSVYYIHEMPKPENVTRQQNDYIYNQFRLLETTAKNNNISLGDGFPSIIDIPSFIDFIIINELASNADAYAYSTFFHKDRNGKLRAGPVWDLDLTFGNDLFFWDYDRSKTNVWQLANRENDGSRFWKDLFDNPVFRCYLSRRWNELVQAGEPLNPEMIGSFIDKTTLIIREAVERDNALWNNTGDHQEQIEGIKSFLDARINWITQNIGSCSDCENPDVPPLVISKIMYHPPATTENDDKEDLEFVEITNNSTMIIDLTGIYFGGTGFVFQFREDDSIDPHSSIILAADATLFRDKYGFMPHGIFNRHLSNDREKLILLDGFGNVIDSVHYDDEYPWPDADGNGRYLKLDDPDLDNSLPENWIASNELVVSGNDIPYPEELMIYPNPVKDFLKIHYEGALVSYTLFDSYGRILRSASISGENNDIDMSRLAAGIYFIKFLTPGTTYIKKVIKE